MDDQNGSQRSKQACAACHRRKLKCDRDLNGCQACNKANLPCIYEVLKKDDSQRERKRKPRGPYMKGKTVREKVRRSNAVISADRSGT